MPDYELHYNSHGLMTRNAVFNYAIGGRGTGKTYDFKYKRIRHFIKTGREFIYLRRYKTEFDDKESFFNDVCQEFPGWEFKVEGMRGYMRRATPDDEKGERWRLCCYFITLANALTKKSVPYPNVDWIGFDEFIIDKGSLHYLRNEVTAFLDFYNTVDRFQDRVRVMFMANAVSITNPYFLYYRLTPRKGTRFTSAMDGFHCCEYIESERFKQKVNETRFGKMISGTAYYDYAVSNRFQDDTDTFIAKKSDEARFYYAIRFDSRVVGIWVDYEAGIYYVSKRYPKNGLILALTKADMQPNLLMIEKSSRLLKSVQKLFMQGSVYFDSVQTREFFNQVFDYLNFR